MSRKSSGDTGDFDPYHKWLGIPKDKRPPTLYQLLGLSPSESDVEVISAAVDRQQAFVTQFQGGPHHDAAAAILFELENARTTLLDGAKRRKYDQRLKDGRSRKRNSEGTSILFGSGSNSVGENGGVVKTFAGIVAIICVAFAVMAWFSFQLPSWKQRQAENVPAAQVPVVEPALTNQKPAQAKALDDTKAPDKTTVFKKTGCRVVWTIAETGDCTLTISRLLEKREAANDKMIRHDDGTVEFQHEFKTKESIDSASLNNTAANVEVDEFRHVLVMTPRTGPNLEGRLASFDYARFSRPPVTLDFDFERTADEGETTLDVKFATFGTAGSSTRLHLVSAERLGKTVQLSVSWAGNRDKEGKPQNVQLVNELTLELDVPQRVDFKIQSIEPGQKSLVVFGVRGEPVSMSHLSVRGRLVPMFEVFWDEKNGEVFAKHVVPKKLGDVIGLKAGDVLVSINGVKPATRQVAFEFLERIQFGEEVEIVVKRNGKTVKFGFTAE